MQWQNPQMLPYSAEQIQLPMMNISNNQPVIMFNYQTDPRMNDYIGFIGNATAMEIQQRAQQNPLRTFMYNQCRANNFQNNDFATLVEIITDNVLMQAMQSNNAPEYIIPNIVTTVVELACAANVRLYEQLGRYVGPDIENTIRGHINTFDNLLNAINGFKRQLSGQAFPQPQGYGGYPSTPVNAGAMMRGGGAPFPPQLNSVRPVSTNTGLFTSSNMSTPRADTSNVASPYDKYERYKIAPVEQPSNQILKQPYNGRATESFVSEVMEEEIKLRDVKWIPNQSYPYCPVFDPIRYELTFKRDTDGTLTPQFKKKDMKMMADGVMDYERHGINTVFGTVPDHLDFSHQEKTVRKLSEDIDNLNKKTQEINQKQEGQIVDISCYVKSEVLCDQCDDESVWFYVDMERFARRELLNERPYAFRAYARIPNPIISFTGEKDYVLDLGASKTLIDVRDKMTAARGKVSDRIWGICNKRMTDTINRVIRSNLSIPGVRIDSFEADIGELIPYLEKKFGQNIVNALLSNQEDIIRSNLQLMFDTVVKQLNESHIQDYNETLETIRESASSSVAVSNESAIPEIIYMSMDCSYTLLDVSAYELEIDMLKDVGCSVLESITPVLYHLVKGIFDDVETRKPIQTFNRHFIRTNDDKVFEVTRGYLVRDYYLITLIN